MFSSQSWVILGENIQDAERLDAKFFYPGKLKILDKIRGRNEFYKLTDLCEKGFPVRGDAPYKPKYVPHGIPVLTTDSLTGKGINWESISYVPESIYRKSRWKIKENDILMASTGMGSITKVDIVGFIPTEFKGKCLATPKLTIIRTSNENIDSYFLWMYLRSYFGQIQILTATRGQTGQLELYPQDIGNILVPSFSRDIQEDVTSKVKKAIKLKTEVFNLKKELSKYESLIFRKVEQHPQSFIIPGTELIERLDVKFYFTKELVKIYSKFDTKLLGAFLKEPIRCGNTPSRYSYGKEGIPIIKVRHLTNEGINWDEIAFVSKEFYNKKKKARVINGDILVVCAAHSPEGIAEKADIVEFPSQIKKCMAVGELLIIRVDSELINPYFLTWVLRSSIMKTQIKKFTRGESGHIYGKDVQHLPIPCVPETLQNEIGRRYKKILKLQMAFSKLLKEAESSMNEILCEYFMAQ